MKFKLINIFFLLLTNLFFSQKKEYVYSRYLTNGAYRYSYYHPKYQKYLDSALVELPKDPFLWQQKAMPYFKKKQYELGFMALDNAVKYDDKYDTYLAYHAFIKCIFQKNYTDAIKEFDILLSHYSKGIIMDHSYYFYKGLSLLQLARYNEAEENIVKSIGLLKNENDAHPVELFYLGIICYEREEYAKGIEFFDKSLKINTKFSDALYYKAKCLSNLKNFDSALESAKKAKDFLAQKYTINEDNVFYEDYPYQIKYWMVDDLIQQLEKIKK